MILYNFLRDFLNLNIIDFDERVIIVQRGYQCRLGAMVLWAGGPSLLLRDQ